MSVRIITGHSLPTCLCSNSSSEMVMGLDPRTESCVVRWDLASSVENSGRQPMLEAGVQWDTPVQCFLLGINAEDIRGGNLPPSGQSL